MGNRQKKAAIISLYGNDDALSRRLGSCNQKTKRSDK